ncbi:MAG TPA: hypothetical protein VG055_31930 [Planctomycetaceae bacterium]|jgi:hypothetical protein|nr:hypothetical protein [Planctomycetaceae bacterium]
MFIGDSTCVSGIDPKKLPFAAYNLGTQRGVGPSGFLITAEAYLHGHPKPRAVVLAVTPFCVETDPTSLGSGAYSGRLESAYGPELGCSPLASAGFMAKRGTVSLFAGADVRDLPLLGHERETYRTREQEARASRGFFCLPGTHGKGQGVPLERPERPVHADWDRGIEDMAKACAEDGVVLLIRFMPIAADVSNARDWTGLEGWARDLESTHANVRVPCPIILPYDQSLMWDSIHINAAGVGKFMPSLARDVQAAFGRHEPFSRSARRGKDARGKCVGVALQRREALCDKGNCR